MSAATAASAAATAGPAPGATTPEMTDPNSTQLYINNLNFNTTQEALTSFFTQKLQQPPSEVNIVANKYTDRSKGFGFVRVPKEKLQLALSLNGATLDDREIGVVEARERTEEERQAQREKRDARRKEIADKRRQEKAEAAAAAGPVASTAGSAATAAGEQPRPRRVRPERKVYENATQLYVSNLSYDVTQEALKALVDEAIGAESLEVDILTRRIGKFKGRSRGYGFVTVPADKLDAGLALNGREVEGRAISVVVARERKPEDDEPRSNPTQGVSGSAVGDGGVPKRRVRPPRRRGGPRTGQVNGGDAAAESKDAEGSGHVSSTTVAVGSSAPTPADDNGPQRRQPRGGRARKPKSASAAAAPAVDVGGTPLQ